MRRFVLGCAALGFLVAPSLASIPAAPLPQSFDIAHRDAPSNDGADYVWRVFCQSGFVYSYIPAQRFPQSNRFEQVQTPQTGDIAWWPEFVAIFVAQNQSFITDHGFVKLADLGVDGAPPRYFRMRVLPGEAAAAPATGTCQRNLL